MRLSIKLLLTSLFALMAMVAVGQGILAIKSLHTIGGSVDDVVTSGLPSAVHLGQINADIGKIRLKQYRFLTTANDGDRREALSALSSLEADMAKTRSSYEPLIASPAEKVIYEQFSKSWNESEADWPTVVAISNGGGVDDALRMFQGMAAAFSAASNKLQEDVDLNVRNANASGGTARDSIEYALLLTYASFGLTIVIALCAMFLSFLRVVQ